MRIGIRNYTVGLIVKLSSDEATLQQQKTLLGKLNMVLVQVTSTKQCHLWTCTRRTWLQDIIGTSPCSDSSYYRFITLL